MLVGTERIFVCTAQGCEDGLSHVEKTEVLVYVAPRTNSAISEIQNTDQYKKGYLNKAMSSLSLEAIELILPETV